jgi:RNA polymerase sigma-70 factor (ECF subfamily)
MIEGQHRLSEGARKLAVLLAATAERDQAAFKMLYDATSAKLFGIALKILRRRDLADDVLQEVYVRIWHHAGRYDPDRAWPITWMVTIVRNLAIDMARNSREHLMEDETELLAMPASGRSAQDEIEISQEQQQLLAALNALDPMKCRLVIAAYLNGESRKQLACRFGAPVPTVKSWLRRAIVDLRSAFDAKETGRRQIAA